MTSNWPVSTAISYKKTAPAMSQMIRKSENTAPTAVALAASSKGIWNIVVATIAAVIKPAQADCHALALPVIKRPSSTTSGSDAMAVDITQ